MKEYRTPLLLNKQFHIERNNLLDYRHLASASQPCSITRQNIVLPENQICIHAQKWRCPCERVYSLSGRCRNSTISGRCIMDSNKNILPRLLQLTPIDFKDETDEVKLILHCLSDFTLWTVAGLIKCHSLFLLHRGTRIGSGHVTIVSKVNNRWRWFYKLFSS